MKGVENTDISDLVREGFITPPKHRGFYAKTLFSDVDGIRDGAIAYIEPGGGLRENHTHSYNHLFIVTDGEVTVSVNDEETIVRKNGFFRVKGEEPHMMYNASDSAAVVIGITTEDAS